MKIGSATREKLWANVAPSFEQAIDLFVHQGCRKEKGKTAKEVLADVMKKLVKQAYESGADRGYDMGHKAFGDGGDDD